MKKTKENLKNKNFTKLTHSGISLIVLVITIIVIIILAAAIIISLNNNNPIMEANKARYESDCANMQAIFTNAVAKVMTKNRATLTVSPGQINDTISGAKESSGQVTYTVNNAMDKNNTNGTIVFDKGNNTDTTFYTGKKLPIYAAGDTKWYVDSEGNISLEVAGTKYGNGKTEEEDPNAVAYAIYSDTDKSLRFYKNSQMPAVGDTYNGLVVTELYKDIETTNYSVDLSGEEDPLIPEWQMSIYFESIEKVIFENKIAPISTLCWFANFSKIESIDLSKLDTSNVVNMYAMFASSSNIKSLDLSNFDTSNVTNMMAMFAELTSLTNLNVSNFDTSKVTDMSQMFMNCSKLTTLDLSNFNTSSVEYTNQMFDNSSSLKTIYVSDLWTVENVIESGDMFNMCEKIVGQSGKTYNEEHIDKEWANYQTGYLTLKIEKAAPKPATFGTAYAIYSADDNSLSFMRSETEPVVGEKYYGKTITNVYDEVEVGDRYVDGGIVTPWSSVNWLVKTICFDDIIQPLGVSCWFWNFTECEFIDLTNLDTSKITDIGGMFGCVGENADTCTITGLDKLNTSNVTDMGMMFAYVGRNANSITLDGIENMNVSNVEKMYSMFNQFGLSTPSISLDLSNWNTSKVTDMNAMFADAGKNSTSFELKGLDKWDIDQVEYIDNMFSNTGLTAGFVAPF